MTLRHTILAAVLACISSVSASRLAAAEPDERFAAAQFLTFGKLAPADTAASVTAADTRTLTGYVDAFRSQVQADKTQQTQIAAKAWRDVFGRDPQGSEAVVPAGSTRLYAELVGDFLQTLAANREEYRAVITRAYRHVVDRAPFDIEITYWEQRAPLPHMLVAACVEHWAQRNAPGLMSTTGEPTVSIHSRQLITLRLSTAVAEQARALVALGPVSGWTTARERHVIAPGAAEIVGVGGIHFLAAGR